MFWKKKKTQLQSLEDTAHDNTLQRPLNIKVVVKTDLGMVRTNNEDAASSFTIPDKTSGYGKTYLLIVADGMGGHLAGEVASKLAVETISEEYSKRAGESNKEEVLQHAFYVANKKIFELASANEQYRGMGTTCTVLVVIGQTVYYAHAGDSRAYVYKNKSLTRITEDHTYVQALVNSGDITEAEAESHPQRNILTNAMGTKPTLDVDTGRCKFLLEPNDRLLLCSDGLTGYLSDDELLAVLSNGSLYEGADYFIAEARKRGGLDNITVVMAEAGELAEEEILKYTREVDVPKLTRDADLLTSNKNDL